jgi:hypothetical protein
VSKKDRLQFIDHIDPIHPELVTDAGALIDADNRIAESYFAHLKKATQDGVGPAIVIFEAECEEASCEFMEKVNFVSVGLMRASLHPFRAALVRDQNQP